MAPSRTPNKSRFLEAATIYRDAMVPFIDGVLGSDRIHSHLFSDKARELNRRKYDDGMRSLQQGKPVRELIDHADIPFLIEDNLRHFSGLDRADVSRMHEIRLLWNDKIKHRDELGDFAPEDATEYATHCARVLRRCGFDADADAVIGTSSSEATVAVTTSDLREQHERREWDKARLAEKSPDELTPWEQQRLNEIEWEEEWERREQERLAQLEREERERERREREGHEREEREREEQSRLARRKREREERQRYERERRERERREPELREREQREIAAFGYDIGGLRRWFSANSRRVQRHPAAYKTLVQQEQQQAAQRRQEREQLEREQREVVQRERREQDQQRWPRGPVGGESRTGDASPKRSLFSRIFRR